MRPSIRPAQSGGPTQGDRVVRPSTLNSYDTLARIDRGRGRSARIAGTRLVPGDRRLAAFVFRGSEPPRAACRAPVAQWQRSRFVTGRLVGSSPLWGCSSSPGRAGRAARSWIRENRYAKLACAQIGGVGEWLIPPDCKSGARKGYVGSNPTPSTRRKTEGIQKQTRAHIAQAVERVLGKNEVSSSTLLVGLEQNEGINGEREVR